MALSLWQFGQLASGLVMVSVLVAAAALCFWAMGWMVLALVSFIPIVGRRGRHARWARDTQLCSAV